MALKYYLGHVAGSIDLELFRAPTTPTEATHGHLYGATIGPFRTKRGAVFMRDHGNNNPHCRCVAEAERIAKQA